MKILLVQTGFLGDVVLSTAVMRSLKEIYPESTLTVLVTKQAEPLIRYHPSVDATLVYDKRGKDRGIPGLLRLARLLREENFAAAFSLHKSYRTAVLLLLSGIKNRYGFKEAALSFLYTKTVPRSDLWHDALRNLAIIRAVGKDPLAVDPKLSLEVPEEARRTAEELLPAGSCAVGMAPGSVWPTKRWMPEGFADVARALSADGCRIVLLGGKDDEAVAAEIERLAPGCLNLAGRTTLLEAVAVIKRLDLLITNDSAPLHFASASGIPVVALFCATVPEFGFGPWQTKAKVLEVAALSCRPCGRHGGRTCPLGTSDCRLKLSSGEVINAAKELLREVAAPASGFVRSSGQEAG